MKTRWRLILTGAGIVVLAAVFIGILRQSTGSELENFKAELRAKGEKISYAELLGEVQEDTNATRFIRAAERLGSANIRPAIDMMNFVAPGLAAVAWKQPLVPDYNGALSSNTWQSLEEEIQRFAAESGELREILKNPAPYFANDYDNFMNQQKRPYVQKRTAAQWFVGCTLLAARQGDIDRALNELDSLADLTRLHGQEPRLVDQMIRSAIAGLALRVTWELLQMEGWNDAQLNRLQSTWMNVDFLEMLELGMIGERATMLAAFERIRSTRDMGGIWNAQRTTSRRLADKTVGVLWQAVSADRDELCSLRWLTSAVDASRRLRSNDLWFDFSKQAREQHKAMEELASSPRRYLHVITLIAVPNFNKASENIVRHEVLRRLTIVAIGIKRYELHHGKLPPDLTALVPDYLESLPLDCMDGKPLKYRPEGNSFKLYSVGEDGIDNGGDAHPPEPIINPEDLEFHTGKDLVWPKAALDAVLP